jgi:NarL family two-component system response regulator LiaR
LLEATATLPAHSLDLILLDIHLPDGTGIELARTLRQMNISTPILMLTIEDRADTIVKALEAGASGYLLKGDSASQVREQVIDFTEGKANMSPSIARRLISWFHERPNTSVDLPLTERQMELLELAARGKTQKEIATALSISEHTVKNHCRNIYERLGVHSIREALIKAKGEKSLLNP